MISPEAPVCVCDQEIVVVHPFRWEAQQHSTPKRRMNSRRLISCRPAQKFIIVGEDVHLANCRGKLNSVKRQVAPSDAQTGVSDMT